MPEEIEVETKDLEETIEEMREERKEIKEEETQYNWTRWISLGTALLAVIAAVASLQAGTLSNHSLAKMSQAGLNQSLASDQWGYYQAKSIKALTSTQTAEMLPNTPANASAIAHWKQEADRYKADGAAIQAKAKEYEAIREEDDKEADELMEHHHIFAYCVTFTQVAIALSAIAALTKRKIMWYGSMMIGLFGAIIFVNGFVSQQIGEKVKPQGAAQEHSAPPETSPGDAPKKAGASAGH